MRAAGCPGRKKPPQRAPAGVERSGSAAGARGTSATTKRPSGADVEAARLDDPARPPGRSRRPCARRARPASTRVDRVAAPVEDVVRAARRLLEPDGLLEGADDVRRQAADGGAAPRRAARCRAGEDGGAEAAPTQRGRSARRDGRSLLSTAASARIALRTSADPGQDHFLEHRRVGHRAVERGDALHRRVEVLEQLVARCARRSRRRTRTSAGPRAR